MFKISIFSILFIFNVNLLFAQPHLKLEPGEIEFENVFNRLKNVYLINNGDQTLTIDSLHYDSTYFFVRFNSPQYLPISINPGDSVSMDCIFAGYYYLPSSETEDTIYIYNNGTNPVKILQTSIDYSDDNFGHATINGQISDSALSPISGARVYFFYNGSYIINSTLTDQNGNYSINVPPGNYKICARKDSFYVTFYGQQFDPFDAQFLASQKDSQYTANISLVRMANTSISVSGVAYDSTSGAHLTKGIVVVRKGTHTPTKMVPKISSSPGDLGIYTEFINLNGSYTINNLIQPAYYFVQSFSDYFVPSYYRTPDSSSTFWQNADSVFLDNQQADVNVHMPRDSSIGGGTISGTVATGGTNVLSSFNDVILYAQSTDYNSAPFNFAFIKNNGTYSIPYLPYGNYKIMAQRIGYDNALSSTVTISTSDTVISGVNINFITSATGDPIIPNDIKLYQNFPNPFNPSTRIKYTLPQGTDVTLRVMNILGQQVAVLMKGFQNAGTYEIQFNGEQMSSGVYFVQLIAGNVSKVRKIVLLK